jgi:hypothetical protein
VPDRDRESDAADITSVSTAAAVAGTGQTFGLCSIGQRLDSLDMQLPQETKIINKIDDPIPLGANHDSWHSHRSRASGSDAGRRG